MSDFQSFRDAVLEDDALQEQVISIVNTATANDSGLGDGIATLAKTHVRRQTIWHQWGRFLRDTFLPVASPV